jgi:multidrug resistance efflux pump
MKRSWLLAGTVVAVLAAAAGVLFFHSRSPAARAKVLPLPLPAISVTAEVTLAGTIRPAQVMNVPVPVEGTIEQFMATTGQHVSEGEVLARIKNPRLATAQQTAQLDAEQALNHLKQLESGLIAARLEVSRSEADAMHIQLELDKTVKTFERQQLMFSEGVTPRLVYEKAEHEYNSLKAEALNLSETAKKAAERVSSITAELDPARKALAQKTSDFEDAQAATAVGEVNSPADGVVIARRGKLGERVTPAMSDLFQIAGDPAILEVVARIDPEVAARIHPGQPVAIQIASVPTPATGTVRELRSGQVFVELTNPSPEVRVGTAVQIKIKLT